MHQRMEDNMAQFYKWILPKQFRSVTGTKGQVFRQFEAFYLQIIRMTFKYLL